MAELSANAVQLVNPGESIVFTEIPVPCRRGLVRFRPGSGNILLAGAVPNGYSANFGANISIPEGGTVEPISVAFALDGSTLPATQMIVTPAAVNEYFNVCRDTSVPVWRGCCETLTIRNTSSQTIQVQNAGVKIVPAGGCR